MPRIALDCRSVHANQGGIGRVADQLGRALARHLGGHELLQLYGASLPEGLDLSAAAPPGITRLQQQAAMIDPIWEQLHLPTLLQEHRVDLYHATCFALPVAGRTPAVTTIHDVVFRAAPELVAPRLRDYLDHWTGVALDLADAVITVSEYSRQAIAEHYAFPADRIRVIPNGVAMQPPTDADIERARAAHQLPDQYWLYLGAIELKKNLTVLLDAQRQLLDDDPSSPLLVMAGGQGGAPFDLLTEIERRQLAPHVRHLGYLPEKEVVGLLAGATAFAYPSLYEGFGLPVLEAMTCGAPVVAAHTTSLPEVVGDAGLLAPPHDSAAWADAVRSLTVDQLLAERLRRRGRERAATYTWDACALAHIAVYEETLSARAGERS